MKTAFIFSGQGRSETPVWARSFMTILKCVKKVFDEADEALGLKISDICFNEDERLK